MDDFCVSQNLFPKAPVEAAFRQQVHRTDEYPDQLVTHSLQRYEPHAGVRIEIDQHIEEHRQFHADVHDLAQRALRHEGGVSRFALKLAHRWLEKHIQVSDRHYAAFFADPHLKARRRRGLRSSRLQSP